MSKKRKNSRNPNGSGTIIKRKDGRWEGRVAVSYDDSTGKRKYKSVYGRTQEEARIKLTRLTSSIDNGSFEAVSRVYLEDWLDTWLEMYVAPRVKINTYEKYKSTCVKHMIPYLGREWLCDLSGMKIQRFYNCLYLTEHMSPKSVKDINGTLHAALEKARKLEMIYKNPTELCDLPKAEPRNIHPLEQEQVKALLGAIKDHRYNTLYQLTLFTGLRQGEVLGLTWDCVNFDKKTIRIDKQLLKDRHHPSYCLSPTKSSNTRVITLGPYLLDLLRGEKIKQEERASAAGSAWDNKWNLVFTNDLGGHLCHGTIYNQYKSIVRELGFGNARFHDLRHSFAIMSIENGDDIKTIQSNLGHATAGFTLDVYGHVSQQMHTQSAQRMENYIQSLINSSPSNG